ncbi:PREDICTED: bromodomain-containing protein 2-like [Prunus mume]|uniref:Bromodomain-containing protein 2-like n=1 Tax=Prunus mume TaxID=102107 RepID=A0ABM0NS77_PRUMU|nr:PREDICTED: bromodomain-containing protein 2-like [Prunus mume]
MALSTRNGKCRQFEDGVGPFEKRKRSCSRVSEPKRNVAVEEKPTACLPLRKSSSPKQGKKIIPLASSARKPGQSEEELGFDGLCQTQKSKRQKLGFDCKETMYCSKVLVYLMNLPHARCFEKPVVDPVAENLPGYLEEIWRPMDFGTVKSKLERGAYSSADGFAADVRLIFSNAFRYYPLGRKERAAAKHLHGVFETKWKEAVEKKSKAVCPYPLPKVEGLSPKLKQGKSSSPSRVNLQSQGLGVFHSTKDDDLATLVHHAMDQASENLSPCRASRIQLLKLQFSDTILKANKTLKRLPDSQPSKKLTQRMKQRKLARRAILNVEKSVQFEDPLQDLKQLEMLCGCGSGDTFLQVHLGLPLKKLGLYLKEDDELQGQDEETFLNGDWEEGEIHS